MKRITIDISTENMEFLKKKKLENYQLFKMTVNLALDDLRKKEVSENKKG